MWLLIPLAALAALAFGAIGFGLVPPPHATTLLQVRAGTIRISRGRLQPLAREHVTEILAEAGVTRGFIAITPENRVLFSRQIPEAFRQRLRNVLLNQWT